MASEAASAGLLFVYVVDKEAPNCQNRPNSRATSGQRLGRNCWLLSYGSRDWSKNPAKKYPN
jgi:hypothetical protein